MKILCVSLGCDKNLVDTEKMLGILRAEGYTFTDDETEADIILVNTCCFIGDAKEESINTILELGQLKESGNCRALIVAGCLAQRYRTEIMEEMPEVDACVGTTAYDEIARVIRETLEGKKEMCFADVDRLCGTKASRIVTTGGHYAFLKIAEGCDKHCAYCVIPKVRGRYRSVPMEELVEEAGELAKAGVRELILVAQETTLYGLDLYGVRSLPLLIRRLGAIEGIRWIRLLYCYPEEITQELMEVFAREPKLCHYLDIPIQHASDRILRRMGRRTSQEELRRRIARLREQVPDICLRTTLISGFPGETQEDFEELYRFVNEIEFDRLGVFSYSQEEGTPAAGMPDQVEDDLKESRREELMELQQAIAFEKAQEMVGQTLTVMIEGKVAQEDVYVARTYRDAPNVDGYLFLHTEACLDTGDFVTAQVTDFNEYDLIGELKDELT